MKIAYVLCIYIVTLKVQWCGFLNEPVGIHSLFRLVFVINSMFDEFVLPSGQLRVSVGWA